SATNPSHRLSCVGISCRGSVRKMSDQRSKNHHYVPQFYLRNFANRKGKLWDTWRGPDGRLHEKERSPKSIGSTRELYSTVPFPTKWSDEREDSVEAKFFSDI